MIIIVPDGAHLLHLETENPSSTFRYEFQLKCTGAGAFKCSSVCPSDFSLDIFPFQDESSINHFECTGRAIPTTTSRLSHDLRGRDLLRGGPQIAGCQMLCLGIILRNRLQLLDVSICRIVSGGPCSTRSCYWHSLSQGQCSALVGSDPGVSPEGSLVSSTLGSAGVFCRRR